MASVPCRRISAAPASPATSTLTPRPAIWSAEFLDRRLRQHQEQQEIDALDLATDIILEVAGALETLKRTERMR